MFGENRANGAKPNRINTKWREKMPPKSRKRGLSRGVMRVAGGLMPYMEMEKNAANKRDFSDANALLCFFIAN